MALEKISFQSDDYSQESKQLAEVQKLLDTKYEKHIRVKKISSGTLTIVADNSSLAANLHLQKEQLIELINNVLLDLDYKIDGIRILS